MKEKLSNENIGSQEQDESEREGTWWARCTLGFRQGANHCKGFQVHQGIGKAGGGAL